MNWIKKIMFRVDFHTHSEASLDGGIGPEQYAKILRDERLDVIAITDHNRIDFAVGMQKALGVEHIIVGEEISTTDGDIIGLYLTSKIDPGMTVEDTINAIKLQGGIVYIPHPFEKFRNGIQEDKLQDIIDRVDIIEVINGRALSSKLRTKAYTMATKNQLASASSSDAHGFRGVGFSYTTMKNRPTHTNLIKELGSAELASGKPPFYTFINPKYNKFKNILSGRN